MNQAVLQLAVLHSMVMDRFEADLISQSRLASAIALVFGLLLLLATTTSFNFSNAALHSLQLSLHHIQLAHLLAWPSVHHVHGPRHLPQSFPHSLLNVSHTLVLGDRYPINTRLLLVQKGHSLGSRRQKSPLCTLGEGFPPMASRSVFFSSTSFFSISIFLMNAEDSVEFEMVVLDSCIHQVVLNNTLSL